MNLQVTQVTILVISILHNVVCDQNVSQDNKTKRGIQNTANHGEYSVLPAHHLGTFTEIRSLTPDETPLVDITYKSLQNGYHNQHIQIPNEQAKLLTDSSYDAQNFHPQQFNYEALLQNPQQYFQPQQLQLPIQQSPVNIPQYQYGNNYLSSAYPIQFGGKLSAPLTQYTPQKQLNFPITQHKEHNPIKLYSQPTIYGGLQDSSALKFLQPSSVQYGYPGLNLGQPAKLTSPQIAKPLIKPPQSVYRSPQLQHQQVSSPLFQISQNFKSLEPKFYEPQVFDHPVVPQLQHFIPPAQNTFQQFTKPVQTVTPKKSFTPSPQIIKSPPLQNNREEEDENESNEDDGGNHRVKEEVKGEIYHHETDEHDDESEFNKGYRESARGFPAYDEYDDDDTRSQYHHGDKHGRYENYKPSHHHHDDDDDYHDTDYHHHHEYRKPYNYNDSKRTSSYYNVHDAEGDYSNKKQKKEPKSHNHSYHESYKYHKKGEADIHLKKPIKDYEKKYRDNKPAKSSFYKTQSDSKYAGDTLKTQQVKQPTKTLSRELTQITKSSIVEPRYHYGFEPIKAANTENTKVTEDQIGKYSASKPEYKNKIYKENWYISKTKEV